jgi:hypothetical protein
MEFVSSDPGRFLIPVVMVFPTAGKNLYLLTIFFSHQRLPIIIFFVTISLLVKTKEK